MGSISQYQAQLMNHAGSDFSTEHPDIQFIDLSKLKQPSHDGLHGDSLRSLLAWPRDVSRTLAVKAVETLRTVDLGDIHITIGNATPRVSNRRLAQANSVVIEHGQVRWIADGPASLARQRHSFRDLCERSRHVWLTNVDQRSLDLAEQLFAGKWSLLPHPYVLDPMAPYPPAPLQRKQLCDALRSNFLVFSASSISIGGDQRKGTDKLLKAVSELRNQDGLKIGLVLVKWGAHIERAEKLISELGLEDCCAFVDPMPRINLQKFMSHFDIVSDQFDYDAFGSLTIRTLEQGMPLLSREIGPQAAKLMGRKPPVLGASTTSEIAAQLRTAWSTIETMGREEFLLHHRIAGREWILRRHHHQFTAALQLERYAALLSHGSTDAQPGRWGEMADAESSP
jgi:hypothetical protein